MCLEALNGIGVIINKIHILWRFLMDLNERFDLSGLNNEELERKLQEEFMYYAEDLDELCHIIRKQLPRKMIYRIISKLYRLRGVK